MSSFLSAVAELWHDNGDFMPNQYLKDKRKTSSSYWSRPSHSFSCRLGLLPQMIAFLKLWGFFPFPRQVNEHTIIILPWHLKWKQGGW